MLHVVQYSTQNKISMSMELGHIVTSVFSYINMSYLCRIVLIRILWNLVTLFSTIISSSLSIMVFIAPCLQELPYGPLFIHHLKQCPLSKSNTLAQNFMKLGHMF